MYRLLAHSIKYWLLTGCFVLANSAPSKVSSPKASQPDKIWSVLEFVEAGLEFDPILKEEQYRKSAKDHQINATKNAAILPRFRARLLYGPAPDISQRVTTREVNGVPTEQVENQFDFSTIGPYFGAQLEFNQPLNLSRLSFGLSAARADLEQLSWEIQGKRNRTSQDIQKIYYGLSFAKSMNQLATKALKEFNRAIDAIEEKLDEEDESVSQFDLLELKANKYALEKGLYETQEGMARAALGMEFSLGLEGDIHIQDSIITKRPEPLLPLDSLKEQLLSNHPDLHRLRHGLKAKRALVNLAAGEMGPGFFIFGQLNYAKSWAGDRTQFEDDVFSQDPLNRVDGVLGIGIQYELNFWSKSDKLKRARIEYNQLKKLDYYAAEGLLLKLEEQYNKVLMYQKRIKSAKKSLRASDAWLKGAAMKFDIDPSQSGPLMKAFQKNMLNRQDLYKAIYDYNIAWGALIEKSGWTLSQYHSIYITKSNHSEAK